MNSSEFRPKSIAMQEFEHQHGRDIADLLQEAYDDLGTQRRVAEKFNLEQSTLSRWMKDLGLRRHRPGRRVA